MDNAWRGISHDRYAVARGWLKIERTSTIAARGWLTAVASRAGGDRLSRVLAWTPTTARRLDGRLRSLLQQRRVRTALSSAEPRHARRGRKADRRRASARAGFWLWLRSLCDPARASDAGQPVGYDPCTTALSLLRQRAERAGADERIQTMSGSLDDLRRETMPAGRFNLALILFGVLGHIRHRRRAEGVRHPLLDRERRTGARAERPAQGEPLSVARGEAAEVLRAEAQAVLAMVLDEGRRGTLADVVAAIDDGELEARRRRGRRAAARARPRGPAGAPGLRAGGRAGGARVVPAAAARRAAPRRRAR